MHRTLIYSAYGWLALSGVLHFFIDVVAQYARQKRAPGPETTLYYGLNTSYALGQFAFALVCLWLAWKSLAMFDDSPLAALSIAAGLGWLIISFMFIEYQQPKIAAGVFLILVIGAIATA